MKAKRPIEPLQSLFLGFFKMSAKHQNHGPPNPLGEIPKTVIRLQTPPEEIPIMTTITIDLPDHLAAELKAKAVAWKVSAGEVLEAAAIQLILNDGSGEDPLDLSPEEEAAAVAARVDMDAGRTVLHNDAMIHFRKVLARSKTLSSRSLHCWIWKTSANG